jgi:amino acid transporter
MSIRGAAFLGIGAMVGAGIFALLGEAGAVAGSAVWISFLLAGIVATLLGYTVVKLGVRYPSSGGIIAYVIQGFGNGRLVGIAAWLGYFAAIVIVCSMVAVSFGSYATSLFIGDDAGSAWDNVFTTIIVVAMAFINIVGSKVVDKAQSLIVIVLLAVFAVFVVATMPSIDLSLLSFDGYPPVSDIVASVALTFFAYLGFSVITFAVGDLRNPARELPSAMWLALGVTTLTYLLISISVFGTLSVAEVVGYGETAIAEAARPTLGDAGFTMMAIAAMLATASSVNATLYASGRLTSMLAEAGQFPPILGRSSRLGAHGPLGHRRDRALRVEPRRSQRDRLGRERLLTGHLRSRRRRRVQDTLGDGCGGAGRARGDRGDSHSALVLRGRHRSQRARDVCRDRGDRRAVDRPRLRMETDAGRHA